MLETHRRGAPDDQCSDRQRHRGNRAQRQPAREVAAGAGFRARVRSRLEPLRGEFETPGERKHEREEQYERGEQQSDDPRRRGEQVEKELRDLQQREGRGDIPAAPSVRRGAA